MLSAFRPGRPSESAAEIADALAIDRTTVHRYLATLRALGYVDQRHTSPRYRLQPAASQAGQVAIASTGLQGLAAARLTELRRATSCTVRLAVRIDLDALVVDLARSHAAGQGLLGVDTRPGARLPGWCTALGRALVAEVDVACLPPDLRTVAIRRSGRLDRVKHLGYAIEDEEHEPSVCAIAAPIRAASGATVAAIDVVGAAPQVTLAILLESHLPRLRRAARQVGEEIDRIGLPVG